MAIVLELYQRDVESGKNLIRNPGGYFRAYCRMVAERKISLVKELRRMASGRDTKPRPGK